MEDLIINSTNNYTFLEDLKEKAYAFYESNGHFNNFKYNIVNTISFTIENNQLEKSFSFVYEKVSTKKIIKKSTKNKSYVNIKGSDINVIKQSILNRKSNKVFFSNNINKNERFIKRKPSYHIIRNFHISNNKSKLSNKVYKDELEYDSKTTKKEKLVFLMNKDFVEDNCFVYNTYCSNINDKERINFFVPQLNQSNISSVNSSLTDNPKIFNSNCFVNNIMLSKINSIARHKITNDNINSFEKKSFKSALVKFDSLSKNNESMVKNFHNRIDKLDFFDSNLNIYENYLKNFLCDKTKEIQSNFISKSNKGSLNPKKIYSMKKNTKEIWNTNSLKS